MDFPRVWGVCRYFCLGGVLLLTATMRQVGDSHPDPLDPGRVLRHLIQAQKLKPDEGHLAVPRTMPNLSVHGHGLFVAVEDGEQADDIATSMYLAAS